MAENWSRPEVDLVVKDYLEMLAAHFSGQKVNKAERRRLLQTKLNDRNESSVERKRSNISAVVDELGFHYLPGYKPLPNYQKLLISVVLEQIALAPWLDQAAQAAVELPAIAQVPTDFKGIATEPPRLAPKARQSEKAFQAVRRDYLEREARNRSLGRAGEEFTIEFERWRLSELGEEKLAKKVDWVSDSKGDGLGYDIHSFEADGQPRYIEVKTTAFGVATPFFLSDTELRFAGLNSDTFHLYRLFQFRQDPKLFRLAGDPKRHCILDPVSYRASFQ